MFGTLIDIDSEGKIFFNEKRVALIPELLAVYKDRRLGSDWVRWIVSVEDYKSPFRKLTLKEREEECCVSYFNMKSSKYIQDPVIVAAREMYRKIQYDPLIDQYLTMRDKTHEMTKVLRDMEVNEKNLKFINDIQDKLGKSAVMLNNLKKMIQEDAEDNFKIKGSDSSGLSMFEEELSRK